MIVTSSSRGETDDSVYIWTRKFLSVSAAWRTRCMPGLG